MKVKLDPNNEKIIQYEDLTRSNVYRVIGIEADSFRIMSDMGAPYLYDSDLFLIVDPQSLIVGKPRMVKMEKGIHIQKS